MVDKPASRNSNPIDQKSIKQVPPKRAYWFNRFLTVLLMIGMIGWFAPVVVATTELRNQLLKKLLPEFPGACVLGETSLGWFSPINIKDVRVTDEEGQQILDVGQITSTKSLWTLVLARNDLGTMKIVQPVLHASLSDHDSNLERFLARLLPEKSSTSQFPNLALEIDDARINLEHVESKSQSSIERISVRAQLKRDGLEQVSLSVGNATDSGEGPSGTDWCAARFGCVANEPSPNSAEASTSPTGPRQTVVKASHWNLDRWKPLLSRFLPNSELSGEVDIDATIRLPNSKSSLDWDWNGSISVKNLLVVPHERILRDRLHFDQVGISGRAISMGGRLALHDFKVATDVGEISATGECSLDVTSKNSVSDLIQSLLSDEDYHLRGAVDLKKLAALLPQTLHMREGIEITSGDIRAEFVGVNVDGIRRWSGTADISSLSALRQGQQISWDRPISWRTNAHRDHDKLMIDLLECKADFLQVTGQGTLDDARYTASGDLTRLAQHVEQFVDLGLDQFSGQMKATGEIKRSDAENVSLTSKIMLDDFAFAASKDTAWREKHLELSINCRGQTDARPMLTRVDAGEIHLKSGNDAFDFVLQQPIDFNSPSPAYVANMGMSGELASWQNRLRPFTATADWKLFGTMNLTTSLSTQQSQIVVNQVKVALQNFVAEKPGWQVKDAEVTLETAGNWDLQAKRWTSPKLALSGKSAVLNLVDLDCSFGPQGISNLTGSASYQADLVQLSSWKNQAIRKPSHYLIGSLSGTAKLAHQNQSFSGDLEAQVEKLVVAGLGAGPNGQPQWVPLWKEPRLKVSGRGSYDQPGDLLTLESGQIEVEGFSAGAQGKLTECFTNQRIELAGQLLYDWDKLLNRFGPQPVQEIQLSGQDKRPFNIKGSLASLGRSANGPAAAQIGTTGNPPLPATGATDLSGEAGLGWTGGMVYGLKLGAGDVKTQFEQGVCRFAPIDLPVNDGRLRATPTIYLDRTPSLLTLPQGKIIDRVSLSRELCNSWLKFAAPMLAECAQVEGRISLDLQQASMPLGFAAAGNGEGLMTIHGAQAHPGPLAVQIIQSIDQVRSIITRQAPPVAASEHVWVEMPEQQVPVKLEQGRMFHEGMTFIVARMTVRTSGSVGMDSSLNLVAQIPLKDDWIVGNNLLKGKSIQVPISGTISRPKIDPKFFASLAQQLGGSLVNDLLPGNVGGGVNQIINNGLDKLLNGNR